MSKAVSGLGTGPVAAITVTVALFLIFIISVTIVVIVVGKAIWKKRHKGLTIILVTIGHLY